MDSGAIQVNKESWRRGQLGALIAGPGPSEVSGAIQMSLASGQVHALIWVPGGEAKTGTTDSWRFKP